MSGGHNSGPEADYNKLFQILAIVVGGTKRLRMNKLTGEHVPVGQIGDGKQMRRHLNDIHVEYGWIRVKITML